MKKLIQFSKRNFSNIVISNHLPKYYADVNININPPEYSDYENVEIKFG